jgi:hypothetical protein
MQTRFATVGRFDPHRAGIGDGNLAEIDEALDYAGVTPRPM